MDRHDALWGVDAAEVILQQRAYEERESGKPVNWGAGQSVLDRVTQILNKAVQHGADA